MTDTATSYSNRANAKRAAEKMIENGTAPAVDYGIKPRNDGWFDIKWKTSPEAEANPETATETATGDDEPAPDPFARIYAADVESGFTRPEDEPAPEPAPAATEPAQSEAARRPRRRLRPRHSPPPRPPRQLAASWSPPSTIPNSRTSK